MNAKIELRPEGISGNGIFAMQAIEKDERLVVFGGRVMTLDEERALPESIADYAHQIADDLVIGITKADEVQPVDHLNHSCTPNAGFKGQIFLVAMRDIAPNEEITFDYAMALTEADADEYAEGILCLCGSSACRNVIRDSDWRLPEIRERYNGYFQYYIQQKIDAESQPL